MQGVKEVFVAVSSTVLPYACATSSTLAMLVPSLHFSCSTGPILPLRLSKSQRLLKNPQFRALIVYSSYSSACNPGPMVKEAPVQPLSYWVMGSFRCGTPLFLHPSCADPQARCTGLG